MINLRKQPVNLEGKKREWHEKLIWKIGESKFHTYEKRCNNCSNTSYVVKA